ncbi:MAG: hypothetical protein VKL39_04645 [Leptolyngbyaceae bacterium]|nr:hypothetical protein [Leptolyngbyaceae bacterium]
MKLSFRGAIYESPFPTLELSDNVVSDYNSGVSWRFQHLKAFMDEQGHQPQEGEDEVNDAILLAIWEPAPTTETRTRPFLFVAKHLLSSEEEAKDILAQYLKNYESKHVHPPVRIFVGSKDLKDAKVSAFPS